jgi:hypothetical protein
MGWFDSFIGDGGWIGPALMAGATLYASNQATQANLQAAQIAAQASARQVDAIREGTALAQQRFDTVQQQAQPAVQQLQRIAATDPYALSPAQQQEVDDARRQTLNALAVSGLRGSGRATVAAVRKVEDSTRGRLIDQNQQRADTATTGLAGQYFNAVGQAANIDAASGYAAGHGYANQGGIQASALLANANVQGRALGDIAAVTADALKEGRKSYYRDNKPAEKEEL